MRPPSKTNNGTIAHIYLTAMSRTDFEQGIAHNHIQEEPVQRQLPPWLDGVRDRNPATLDAGNTHKKHANSQRIAHRLCKLQPALDQLSEILDSVDPERRLNEIARNNHTNAPRFRLWFLPTTCSAITNGY